MTRRSSTLLVCLLIGTLSIEAKETHKKPLELVDLMKLRQVEDTVIADNGSWVAYALVPDRGDATLVVERIDGTRQHTADRGRAPQITADGLWAAARVEVPVAEALKREKNGKGKKKDDGPKPGLVLIATESGAETHFERVEDFAFSADGRWLVRRHAKAEKLENDEVDDPEVEEGEKEAVLEEPSAEGEESETLHAEATEAKGEGEKEDEDDEELGTSLVLRHLETGDEVEVAYVESFAVDDVGRFVAYSVRAPGGDGNGVFVRTLGTGASEATALHSGHGERYHALTWSQRPTIDLGFVIEPATEGDEGETTADATTTDADGIREQDDDRTSVSEVEATSSAQADAEPPDAALFVWSAVSGEGAIVTTSNQAPEGWYLPSENELVWSRDAQRLFFGYRPRNAWQPPDDKEDKDSDDENEEAVVDLYDFDQILEDRTVDVWHVNDPLIQTNQRSAWEDEQKRLYRAVYHQGEPRGHKGRAVLLAGIEARNVAVAENPRAVLSRADIPYQRERTWDGFYFDLYWVSLADGERRLVAEHLHDATSLSPDGRYVAYFDTPHWYLWDSVSGTARSLTADHDTQFANEDHDYPRPADSYGVADWLEDSSAILINDKYDLWSFPAATESDSSVFSITDGHGRDQQTMYRVVDLDPHDDGIAPGERLLLSGYHDRQKHRGFHWAQADRAGVTQAFDPKNETVRFQGKARDADAILLTRESYTKVPDLWAAKSDDVVSPVRLSDANPEIAEFGWGDPELVEWRDLDGREMQGILIKPAGYEPGRRYPVLVYFYRFFSQRLHLFNEPAVNHRPSFPVYASDGYAVFLPDVRFEIGRPGLSAVKALVPGVQKLIEMGIADPDAIGLHGHSWSGYQTAFAVTQTNIFKAAVAGAPVSNMTSAYGGIRWGSGLARQFQYEQGQSRLGANLWEARDRYIDNSPLFFADRIETPLLLMHGDEDDAVPWYQSIELYLALRRLGKEAVFLHYRGEPHHPRKYANKLDYSIKMKAFFDHYLKGEPAPEWLAVGVPFAGD